MSEEAKKKPKRATDYTQLAAQCRAGETVSFRPHGNSMLPRIKSGQKVTVTPVPECGEIEKGDIVFCKVRGSYYVHLCTARKGDQYQISNNHGHVNGWVGPNSVFGKVTKVEE